MMSYEIWDGQECIAHVGTEYLARIAASGDSGRTLTVYDPPGRIVAIYVSGRPVNLAP